MRIKICGLTRREDALAAAQFGADALGFVFAPRSRRRVDVEAVADMVATLPPFVTAVGVFQDQPLDEVNRIIDRCQLALAQLHGHEDVAYLAGVRCRTLKALSLAGVEDLQRLATFPGQTAFLLDSGSGGTGETFDWDLALRAKAFGRIVLSGGLTPDNVATAVAAVRPWAVDGASGTEAAPGVKDSEKLRTFIANARRAAGRMT
ncbi:MAG: phosphoribosylanthranilate isomerase [Deferrisomatales bacterium]|nr:phosphoribosylanthranilate isomerase [Deferrisomatales bacterium]